MTSRERIVAAINHKPTDELPIDFGGMRSTGISIVAYDKLVKYLKLDEHPKLYDVFQQLAEPSLAVLDRLGGDVVQAHRLCPAFGISIEKWKKMRIYGDIDALVPEGYSPVENPDGTKTIFDEKGEPFAKMPAGGYYFDIVQAPLKDVESVEDLEKIYRYTPMSQKEVDFIEAEVKRLYETTDKAILFPFGGNILEAGETDFGFERFMELLLLEPEIVHAYYEKLTAGYMQDLKTILPKIAPYINIIQFGDDLGSQDSLLVSRNTYREMIFPYHKMLYRFVQDNYPDVKVFLHSCGAIEPLIGDLIEAGVQILNPVQITATGMDPVQLKEKYGKDLVFWGGGARMQTTVLGDDIDAIRKEVEELIGIFGKDGGYVFNQVHNIQANVAPEKVVAIYDTAQKIGRNK